MAGASLQLLSSLPTTSTTNTMLLAPHEMAMAMGAVDTGAKSRSRRGFAALSWHCMKLCLATALLVGMVIVIRFTDQSQILSDARARLPRYLTLDVSTTLTIVRAMQGVLTTVVTMALSKSFEFLQWGFLRNTRGGAPYIRQLALSPTTSVSGTLQLILHPASGWGPRFWGFLRILLLLLVGLGGVVLFCELIRLLMLSLSKGC